MPFQLISCKGSDDDAPAQGTTNVDGRPQASLPVEEIQTEARMRSMSADLRTLLRRQTILATVSRRALQGLEPHKLLDEAVALVARMLTAEDSEVREFLTHSRDVERRGSEPAGQTPRRTFSRTEAALLCAVANVLALASQRVQVEDRYRTQGVALARRLQEAQEGERQRLARDLHDELGQRLTGLQLDIAWLAKRLRGVPVAWQRHLEAMATQLEGFFTAVHRIATELRPKMLADVGLRATIEWQLQEARRQVGIAYDLGWPSEQVRLDEARELAVSRIVQEALTNVLRHAKASRVTVRARQDADAFYLEVSDNGRGITPAQLADAASLGLMGMRERAQLLAGVVTIEGKAGEGTTVAVCMPCAATAGENAADAAHRHRR